MWVYNFDRRKSYSEAAMNFWCSLFGTPGTPVPAVTVDFKRWKFEKRRNMQMFWARLLNSDVFLGT